jgi:hypothetical protein
MPDNLPLGWTKMVRSRVEEGNILCYSIYCG